MARIFISYKRKDRGIVFPIKDRIEKAIGEKCWIDLDGIESDAQFVQVIISAINACDIFLFMYSRNHVGIEDFMSDWTIRELQYADSKGKRIVFVNLDRSPLVDWFKFMFGQKQQVDALSADSMEKLIGNIKGWLGSSSPKQSEKASATNEKTAKHNGESRAGVNVLAAMPDGSLLYFFQGMVYIGKAAPSGQSYLDLGLSPTLGTLKDFLLYNFDRSPNKDSWSLTLEDFIKEYGPKLRTSGVILMSYFDEDDYMEALRFIHSPLFRDSNINFRLLRESAYIIFNLISQIEDSSEEKLESVHILRHREENIAFSYSQGVCELIRDRDEYLRLFGNCYCKGRNFIIRQQDNLRASLLGGFIKMLDVLEGRNKDCLLINMFPFDIGFGPLHDGMIPPMLERNSTSPFKHHMKFDLSTYDRMGFKIGKMEWRINLDGDKNGKTKEVSFSIQLGSSDHQLEFSIEDRNLGKTYKIPVEQIPNLLHLELK